MAVSSVSVFVEPVFQCLGCTVEILLGKEVEYLPTGVSIAGCTTGDEHSESSLSVLDACLQTQVGDVGVVGRSHTGIYCHLVFSRHGERIFLCDESGGEFLHVWIDIEFLFSGESAPVIHHHIAYGITTATCAGDAHFLQLLESRNGIFDINIVNLNLLSGGNVEMRSGELVTYEGNLGKLLWGDETAGTAKAQHIVLVLALLVDAHRHAV